MSIRPFRSHPAGGLSPRASPSSIAGRMSLFLTVLLVLASSANAQLQQPFVYTTGGAIATRNDATGVLAPTSASPLAVLGAPAVLDAKGRFLFAAGNNSIHMYQVDSVTGSYTEVPGSPFASPNTNSPTLIAIEPTGAYLAVVNSVGLNPGESSVESFQINATAGALVPVSGSFLELVSTSIGAGGNPALGTFYVYLGPNPLSSNPFYLQDGELLIYTIDSLTGLLGNETGSAGSTNRGRSFGADPLGRFVAVGQGASVGDLQVTSATGVQGLLSLGPTVFPDEIFVGPGQRFIYVTVISGAISVVHIYIVDTTTWSLTEAPSSPLPGFTSVANFVADPTGQFVYQSTAPDQVRVYSVDLSTGYFTETSGSPFTAPGFGLPIAFSVAPGSGQPEVGPVATLTPANLVFGSSAVGIAAPTQSLMLSSTGDQALSVNAIKITGLNAGDFSEIDNCNAPTALKTTDSCLITVNFTPTASGSRLAQFTVTDNAPGSPQSVALTGTGLGAPPPAPAITFTPGTLNFSVVTPGSTSLPLSVTLTNSGNAPLNIFAITLGGGNPADFSAPSSNCTAAPIAPGASCTATESFTPLAVGFRQAALIFADNAAGSPQSITLIGTEVSTASGPALTFLPTTVNFPALSQGSTSSVQSIIVANSGTAPVTLTAITLGGSNPSDFSAPASTCIIGLPLLPNASCVVNETFTPSAAGVRQAALTFTDNASGSPQSVALIGTGINSPPSGPALKFLPTSVTFPATTQGLASTPIAVAITNTGTVPMHISSISAAGNSPADFMNSVASCSNATVAANASCTVSVIFSPIFSGPRSETLTVTDDAPNSPQVLTIFANAPPAFSISSPSNALSATVSAGQSASYALQLTPGLDYNGTISFTCTGVPLGAICQAPASVTLNVGAPAALTVTVVTSGGAITTPKLTSRRLPHAPASPGALTVALGTLLFILGLRLYRECGASIPALGSHGSGWKITYAMAALLIFLPLIFAADGCGGGSTIAPTAQKTSVVTPSGTSTLVITPTATNASGKPLQMSLIQLTLVVN
jgi:hypothetical protein